MSMTLLDNDVLAKATAYSLLDEMEQAFSLQAGEFGVLGSVVFVIKPRRLQKASGGGEQAHERLKQFVGKTVTLEPTETETMLAAQLEDLATRHGLQFDVGESQLAALTMSRNVNLLCTGDKRAIAALERLRALESRIEALDGKVVCLELLICKINSLRGHNYVREKICASKGTDLSIEICYQCHQSIVDSIDIDYCLPRVCRTIARSSSRNVRAFT